MSATALPFMFVGISRQEVESGDTSVLSVLLRLLDKESATLYREMVDIAVFGYDDDPRELYEVPEVRDFVRKLDAEFPYWFYFLSKRGNGLLFILYCLCSPDTPPEARDQVWRHEIMMYLKRGIPAMNHICKIAGCSEAEVMRLTNGVLEYIISVR
jgi:hypothetical protein